MIKKACCVRARKDRRGVDLISDVLPFGRLWYDTPDNAIGYAMHSSRLHDAMIRVYNAAGNVIETREQKGDFKEWLSFSRLTAALRGKNDLLWRKSPFCLQQ